MTPTWPSFAGWLLHSAAGGGLLLLLAWPLMRACRQPARRQRLGESALLAALLLGVLNLGPSWITLPLLTPERPSPPTLTSQVHSSQLSALLSVPRPPGESAADSGRKIGEPKFAAGEDRDGPAAFEDAAAILALLAPEAVSSGSNLQSEDTSGENHQPGSPRADSPPATDSRQVSFTLGQWLTFITLAYAAASALLLGRWLFGHFALWRLLRTARPAPEAINDVFETMARGQGRRPRLLVSRRLRVPLSCGLIRPCVVVPASLCEPNAARTLRWVFAHELTHLQRGDAWACLLFGLGQALYFCLPWFWWLRRQVRLCQEYIADAAAAEQAADPEDYAQFLVSLTRAPALPLGALGVLGNSSDLLRRVTMLLQNPIGVERRCPHWWSLATAGSLLGLALLLSGIGLHADAAPAPDDREAAKAAVDQGETPTPAEEPAQVERPAKNKETKKRPAVERILRDLEELLKEHPSALDADQVKELREQLKKFERDAATEDLRERLPSERLRHENLDQVRQWAEEIDASKLAELAGPALWQRKEGRLGVEVRKPSPALADQLDLPKGRGLVIEHVVPGSAAAKAGLKAHDILLEFNGKPVPNEIANFVKILEGVKANTPVDAIVLRKGQKEPIKGISLPEAKAKQPFQFSVVPGQGAVPILPGGPHILHNLGPNIHMHAFTGHGDRAVMTTMFRTKDSFNTRYQEGSLVITVTGSITEGKSKVKQIEVQDGGKSETYDSVDKVPEQYRDKVKNLIEMSEKNNVKIEIGGDFEIIKLKNARAIAAAKTIDEAFNDRQTIRNRIRVVADPSTNSLWVKASPPDMLTIRSLVKEYIDNSKINEKAIIKTWKLGPFKHAKAKDVYWLIKDVYREHLNNQLDLSGKGAFRNSFIYGMENLNTNQNGEPRGVDLSVTYDSQTKTVFLSCNELLYQEIKKLVDDYDSAQKVPAPGHVRYKDIEDT